MPLEKKIEIIARKIYGADGIELSDEAKLKLERYAKQVIVNYYICLAPFINLFFILFEFINY